MPPKEDEVKSLLTKAIAGLLCVCTTVSIGLGSFALKETVAAQLALRELNVRMLSVETSVAGMREQHTVVMESIYSSKLTEQRMARVESDVTEIKKDLRELLQRK